jgi:hypothetical protein
MPKTEKLFRFLRPDARSPTALIILTAVGLAAVGVAPTIAAEPAASPAVEGGALATQGETVWLVPPTGFYPPYLADPRRPQMAAMVLFMSESEIPEAGDNRFGIRLGGSPGIVRFHPAGDPTRGLQIDIEGGFYGQFDIDASLDVIGWDGLYGLYAAYKPRPELGFRFGGRHDSAHIGDEYIEKTDRERIRYTREELVAAVSWAMSARWRIYGDYGWAYTLRNDQERGRLQAGLEFRGQRQFWNDQFSWYGAVDVNCFEERDWSPAIAAQIGLLLPGGGGGTLYRFAFEFYTGRSLMGEFSFSDERYLSLGFYVDF